MGGTEYAAPDTVWPVQARNSADLSNTSHSDAEQEYPGHPRLGSYIARICSSGQAISQRVGNIAMNPGS